jgi:hypothetical protein
VRIAFSPGAAGERDVVATMLRCFPPLDDVDAEVDLTLVLHAADLGWDVESSRTATSHVPTRARLLSHLVSLVNRAHLDHDPGHGHLHAGAVARDGRSAVVLGHSGSGKSTLVGELVRRGAAYLSDEVVGLDSEGRALSFPKPLTVKHGAWSKMSDLVTELDLTDDVAEGHRWELPPDVLGVVAPVDGAVPVGVVALCTWDPQQAEPVVAEPLDPVDAVLAMAEHSLDLERDPALGLVTLATLAAGARSFRLRHRDDELVASWFREQLALEPVHGPEVQVLAADAPSGPEGAGWLRRTAPSVVLGDRALVYVAPQRRVMALNEAATVTWSGLDGRSGRDLLDTAAGPRLELADFLAKLTREGLVAGWTS